MYTVKTAPSHSNPQPVDRISARELVPPETRIRYGDDRSNPLSESPILAACRNNNLIWLRELVAEDPGLAQRTAQSGETGHPVSPLHITAQGGHVEATEYLLNTALQGLAETERANAAITLMTIRHKKNGETPLYLAVQNAHDHVVTVFLKCLQALPEVDIAQALVTVMNASQKNGQTPLCRAIHIGDDQMVLCFLQALKSLPEAQRADTMIEVLATCKKGNRTPLFMAAVMGNSGIVKSLLEAILAVPASERSKVIRQVVNATAADGPTPLYIAVRYGYIRIVHYILAVISKVPESERAELGDALVNWANKDGATPLYAAASGKNGAIVELLLEHGADPERAKVRCVPGTCRRSNTPRQVAVQVHCKNIVALIDKAKELPRAEKLQSHEELGEHETRSHEHRHENVGKNEDAGKDENVAKYEDVAQDAEYDDVAEDAKYDDVAEDAEYEDIGKYQNDGLP